MNMVPARHSVHIFGELRRDDMMTIDGKNQGNLTR